jgi:hypothetical protein
MPHAHWQRNARALAIGNVLINNHATDWYETKLHDGRMDSYDHTTYPLSDISQKVNLTLLIGINGRGSRR